MQLIWEKSLLQDIWQMKVKTYIISNVMTCGIHALSLKWPVIFFLCIQSRF